MAVKPDAVLGQIPDLKNRQTALIIKQLLISASKMKTTILLGEA
jgi:hypothetical protein